MPSKNKITKYKEVGIDIKRIKIIQNRIGKDIEKTQQFLNFGKVISWFWSLCGLNRN